MVIRFSANRACESDYLARFWAVFGAFRTPAKVLRAEDRIGEVFDPERVADTADYIDPKAPPVGIPHVLVNGEFVLRDSKLTGATPGIALRHRY